MTEILDEIYDKCRAFTKWANENEHEALKESDEDSKIWMKGEAEGLRVANDVLVNYLIDKGYVPND